MTAIYRLIITCILFATFIFESAAQSKHLITPEKPKLIVVLSVSQFRQDYISRYWDKFSENGFRRIVNRGTICKNTSYNYLISDKGVGTSTLVTGANPSDHGIVAASWYNDLRGKVIPAIYDQNAETIGGPYEAGQCSPHQLLASTFSDEINLSNNFQSKVVGVSLEPASAILSAGHTADAAYWFDIQEGRFISSSYYMDTLPTWVNDFNDKQFPDSYLEQQWNTILPIESYSEGLADANGYELGYNNQSVFPYEMSNIAKIFKKKERYSVLNITPFGNNIVKDFAIQSIVNDSLGFDKHTDVMFLNFTANEQIGQLFGPLSVEMQDAVLRLDREIEHLLNFIDDYIGIENTLVIFTAEHGLPYTPEYLTDHKIPSGYFNSLSATSLLKSYLNNVYGKGDWVTEYHAQQIYLNRTLIESADIKLSDFQDNVANLMLQFHGVQNTLTATALQNTDYSRGAFSKIQNSYNQKRSGDVIINLKNGWLEKHGKIIVSHGTDTRIPLIWYGWKVKRKTIIEPVDLTDVAPTISVLLDISFPNSSTGEPIEGVIK